MTTKARSVLALSIVFCASIVQAKSASEVFEVASPSVVIIKTFDAEGNEQNLGSGVVLEDEVVVTNCHVVKEAITIQVVRHDTKHSATLRHTDWDRDVCTLNAEGLKGLAATKGMTSYLKVGQRVYAIGAPNGLELTLSDGLISSLRAVPGGQYLQITAPISPGSSGGGLFDDEGLLIGLPTFYLADGQQLNFAVPVEWINELPKRKTAKSKEKKKTSTEWLNRSIELLEREDLASLIEHTLHWTADEPKDEYAWYCLGMAYEYSGQMAKAIDAYQQAILINPQDTATWNNLGSAYAKSNQTDKGFDAYQRVLRINPEHAVAWYNIGYLYSETGQPTKAIDALKQAIKADPEYDDAWVSLGVAYGKLNQTDKQFDAYRQALRINPDNCYAWKNIGKVYISLEQFPKAIDALKQAIRSNQEYAAAWYDLGVVYKYLGMNDQVVEVFKRLKSIDPKLANQFYNNVGLF